MANVLITGGSGLIGRHLISLLISKEFSISILSRSPVNILQVKTFLWNPEDNYIEPGAIETADYIIHLAGTNIGEKRWTNKQKNRILRSRYDTGMLLFDKAKNSNHPLKAFISASAIGIYGSITSEKVFTETDPPANDFLGRVCQQWESLADKFGDLGIRTVKIRTGVVLSEKGGVLKKLHGLARYGLNTGLGSGNQFMPWIHIDDLCAIYHKSLTDDKMNGAYNAVAPEHICNNEFTGLLNKACKNKIKLPNIPGWLLKLVFGNMSQILLEGSRVSSEKIENSGFQFTYPRLEEALKNLV